MSVLPGFILGASTLFLLALLIHTTGRFKFCAVCVTISGTWLTLLMLRLAGFVIDPVLIGVLMGESVVGFYYLLEKKVPVAWQIFRWPYIISATTLVYILLGMRSGLWVALLFLALIWLVWGSIFALRRYPSIKKITERLIACCRDW